jgi:triacylglycerol lipase
MNPPVLLVHGIYDTHLLFDKMQNALKENGIENIYAMDIIPADASISYEDMAKQVRNEVDKALTDCKEEKVDIVAFSMGAIASRYFIQKMNGNLKTRRYISISGPHHGTNIAYLSQKIGARQMRPGSVFLNELNKDEGLWGEMKVFSFWSRFDLMVLPASSSRLKNAEDRVFNVPFHNLMAFDHFVIGEVIQALLH